MNFAPDRTSAFQFEICNFHFSIPHTLPTSKDVPTMYYIDPHIHMVSRVTDDYERIARMGCVAVSEPAFWAALIAAAWTASVTTSGKLTEFEPKRPVGPASSITHGSASTRRKPRTSNSHARSSR